MPRTSMLIEERNQHIEREYTEMYKKGYRRDIIVAKLGKKHYLSEATVDNILAGHGRRMPKKQFVDPRQLKLFGEHPQILADKAETT